MHMSESQVVAAESALELPLYRPCRGNDATKGGCWKTSETIRNNFNLKRSETLNIYEECGLVWLHIGCDQFARLQLTAPPSPPCPRSQAAAGRTWRRPGGGGAAVPSAPSAELRLVGNRLRAVDAAQSLVYTTCPFCNPSCTPSTP